MVEPACWLIVLDGKRGVFGLEPIAHGASSAALMQRIADDMVRIPHREPEGLPECLREHPDTLPAPPAVAPDVYILALRRTRLEAQTLAAQFRDALPDARTPLPPSTAARLQAIALGIPWVEIGAKPEAPESQ